MHITQWQGIVNPIPDVWLVCLFSEQNSHKADTLPGLTFELGRKNLQLYHWVAEA